ncbi:hypothetical protein FSP39_021476 [Pinctada imbricata]|uniref:Uncharacterized protein n=1 Tax=Pinctada imbricata TaxID=66713 RepID=A0AA89BY27_PINIB|nr:hypothetical protein FSP39_021476 [Pinctada imbricata]
MTISLYTAQDRQFRKSETEGIQNQDKTETKANKQKPPPHEKKRTPDMRGRPGAQEEEASPACMQHPQLQFGRTVTSDFYCEMGQTPSVGMEREMNELHMKACLYAGIKYAGYMREDGVSQPLNPEVVLDGFVFITMAKKQSVINNKLTYSVVYMWRTPFTNSYLIVLLHSMTSQERRTKGIMASYTKSAL